jgi:hypothetical protein
LYLHADGRTLDAAPIKGLRSLIVALGGVDRAEKG